MKIATCVSIALAVLVFFSARGCAQGGEQVPPAAGQGAAPVTPSVGDGAGQGGEPGQGAEDSTAAPKKRVNALGGYVEVVVNDREMATFQGWIRDRARVELFDTKKNGYIQLADTAANRELEQAGLRLYYADEIPGFIFIKYSKIESITIVRQISPEEEEEWEVELERQLAERRQLLLQKLEADRRAREEEAEGQAQGDGDPMAGGDGNQTPAPAADIPDNLKRGYKLLEDFPPPDWGEDTYKRLRKMQLTKTRSLTIDEQRFVESYTQDWKPAHEHKTGGK